LFENLAAFHRIKFNNKKRTSLYWIFVKYDCLYGAIVSWKGWNFNGISRWWIEIKLDLSHRDFEQLPVEFAYFSIVFLKNVLAKQWKIWIVKGIARNKAFTVTKIWISWLSFLPKTCQVDFGDLKLNKRKVLVCKRVFLLIQSIKQNGP